MEPFFVGDIHEQVMTLHDCVRVCTRPTHECNCSKICRAQSFVESIVIVIVPQHSFVYRDIHATERRILNVYEREHRFCSRKPNKRGTLISIFNYTNDNP